MIFTTTRGGIERTTGHDTRHDTTRVDIPVRTHGAVSRCCAIPWPRVLGRTRRADVMVFSLGRGRSRVLSLPDRCVRTRDTPPYIRYTYVWRTRSPPSFEDSGVSPMLSYQSTAIQGYLRIWSCGPSPLFTTQWRSLSAVFALGFFFFSREPLCSYLARQWI
ncbi:uncharacterized protein K489DRAFT_112701 [Dissoconium aciculare CBS 342.82]|uniref:Uncharacterized protein n=1 Tax=Dissoconium aciculare CBS 342.82 TaxID=1314786 RepID=A0A6J3MHF1_9PEZI|nr:uncharacterized protein K489DRAFT_112701 [Dissoconium aciculare CBS 342.82]KAF1826322.1 hypothetical protein K489DRAFT_112701 [Dissoconium aciculare CBS 342.82]